MRSLQDIQIDNEREANRMRAEKSRRRAEAINNGEMLVSGAGCALIGDTVNVSALADAMTKAEKLRAIAIMVAALEGQV
jgi:hypothetical protein